MAWSDLITPTTSLCVTCRRVARSIELTGPSAPSTALSTASFRSDILTRVAEVDAGSTVSEVKFSLVLSQSECV